ncbi:phospholipase A2 inhibitor and Ly6/PLAUR domain-containing protein [Pogona vitticeps]
MWMSLIFFLFCLLLGIGVCLRCERCSSSSTLCTGIPYPCSETEDSCLVMTTEYVIANNDRWVATYKGCTKRKYCPSPSSSATFPSQRKRRAVRCCQKDFCNKGSVTLPKLSTKPNGLKCPGCFSVHAKCQPTDTLNCHGSESKCVYYDMTVEQVFQLLSEARGSQELTPFFPLPIPAGDQIYTFAKRGCATKAVCKNTHQMYGVPGLFIEIWKTAKCYAAPKR